MSIRIMTSLLFPDNRSKDRIDAFITEDDRRIQIEFMEGNELKHALDSYESLLFKQILTLILWPAEYWRVRY